MSQPPNQDEAGTKALAAVIASHLKPGDTVLLSGPIGAGKSVLARALIRSWLGDPEAEVPSPSYTLVQTYERCDQQLWHVDLYRINPSGEELIELGLDQAIEEDICLVEWPERLASALPARYCAVDIQPDPDRAELRAISLSFVGSGWDGLARASRLEKS